jgi:hypothetical protein
MFKFHLFQDVNQQAMDKQAMDKQAMDKQYLLFIEQLVEQLEEYMVPFSKVVKMSYEVLVNIVIKKYDDNDIHNIVKNLIEHVTDLHSKRTCQSQRMKLEEGLVEVRGYMEANGLSSTEYMSNFVNEIGHLVDTLIGGRRIGPMLAEGEYGQQMLPLLNILSNENLKMVEDVHRSLRVVFPQLNEPMP